MIRCCSLFLLFPIIAWYMVHPFVLSPSLPLQVYQVLSFSPFDEGTSITQCFVNKFLPDFSCSQQMVGHLIALFLFENSPSSFLGDCSKKTSKRMVRFFFPFCIVVSLLILCTQEISSKVRSC